MKFKHYFWDFDGTLFDTYPRMVRALQKGLRDAGIEKTAAELIPLMKVSLPHTLEIIDSSRCEELRACYATHAEEEGFESMQPYPGAERLLQSICEQGGRNYLYTLRGKSALEAIRFYHLDKYFTNAVTHEDNFASKPAPDALLYLMDKHHLSPTECIMLGDRDIDLLSGLNAGMAGGLFDPGHYYDSFDTPYRYTTMFAMMEDLVWDHQVNDLRISDLVSMQEQLQALHPEWGGITPSRGISELLWLVGEVGEVVDVVKKNSTQHLIEAGKARSCLVEEMADVLMYFCDILNCYDISAEEFSKAYYDKMTYNLHRDYRKQNTARYGK